MRIVLVLMAALPLVASCGREPATKGFAQAVSENTVRSEAFGVTAEKPEGWYAMSEEMQEALVSGGAKAATHGNDAIAGAVEAGMARTSQIFAIFKYEPGSPVEFNPNVLALAENLKLAPGVKSGADYFYQFRRLAEQTNAQYQFGEEAAVMIGGKDFTRLDLTMTIAGRTADQSYYAARIGEEMILLIQSYKSDADRAETDAIIKSVRFD